MIDKYTTKTTPTKIEFNINKAIKTFNIRDTVMKLLQEIFKADNSLCIRSKINGTVWGHDDEVPQGGPFHKHFATYEINPRHGNRKVIACIDLISSEAISRLKWQPNVKDYIIDTRSFPKQR